MAYVTNDIKERRKRPLTIQSTLLATASKCRDQWSAHAVYLVAAFSSPVPNRRHSVSSGSDESKVRYIVVVRGAGLNGECQGGGVAF